MRARARRLVFLAAVALAAPAVARAEPPSAELMTKLAARAAVFDQIGKRASYALESRVEVVDGDGKVSGVETTSLRVTHQRGAPHVTVLSATKDGADRTEEARTKARDEEAKSGDKKERPEIPFLAAQQARYAFDVVETDPKTPTRVRIAFTPKEPDAHTVEGSAWVDTDAGQFLSAGFKMSKPGMFVDHVHVTIELGAHTELGPALSRLTFDGTGGFLFVRKHVRGSVLFSDYAIAPR